MRRLGLLPVHPLAAPDGIAPHWKMLWLESCMNQLQEMNRGLLRQAITLVEDHVGDQYTTVSQKVFSSSIGQHIRHCVEHYEEFIVALASGRDLNYEQRPRDLTVETNRQAAISRLLHIHEVLATLPDAQKELGVWDTGAESPALSSVSRELQYLLSHTVHHCALIAIIASEAGLVLPTNFGIAPSTLKHRAST
jgi:uncharacterized damage-inducible protein DinB